MFQEINNITHQWVKNNCFIRSQTIHTMRRYNHILVYQTIKSFNNSYENTEIPANTHKDIFKSHVIYIIQDNSIKIGWILLNTYFAISVLGSLHGAVFVACREKDGEVGRKRHHGSEVCTNVAHHLIMLFLIQLKSTKPRDKKLLCTNNTEILLKYNTNAIRSKAKSCGKVTQTFWQ